MTSHYKKSIWVTTTLLLLVVLCMGVAGSVFAQAEPDPSGEPYQGEGIVPCDGVSVKCNFAQLVILTERVIRWLLFIAIFISAVLFAYAGFLYTTSAGDEGKVKKAHTIFGRVLVGFLIALAAWLIVYTITSTLLNEESQNLPLLERT